MSNILIIGATGNIGFEVVRFLSKLDASNRIVAGVRNIEKAKIVFKEYQDISYTHFDFNDFNTFDSALEDIDKIFLLRPPHISDVDRFFKPLILKIQEKNIKQIVFLSVQGADKNKMIPHSKIERLISNSKLDFIFVRPSYFMQNLTTTLLPDIKHKCEIVLPAGKAKFNWVDVENIGELGAILLHKFNDFKNQAIEITGLENENFERVTQLINSSIESPIEYRNVNPIKFYRIKRREGMEKGMIIVMTLLHFLPRFQKEPRVSHSFEQLTGKKPTDLKIFIEREKKLFTK